MNLTQQKQCRNKYTTLNYFFTTQPEIITSKHNHCEIDIQQSATILHAKDRFCRQAYLANPSQTLYLNYARYGCPTTEQNQL